MVTNFLPKIVEISVWNLNMIIFWILKKYIEISNQDENKVQRYDICFILCIEYQINEFAVYFFHNSFLLFQSICLSVL